MTKYYNNSIDAMHLQSGSRHGRDKMVVVTRGACGCCSYEEGVSVEEAIKMLDREINELQSIKKVVMQAKKKTVDVCDSCGNLSPKKDLNTHTFGEGTEYSESFEYCPTCYNEIKSRAKKRTKKKP
jgi:hypothetical protein